MHHISQLIFDVLKRGEFKMWVILILCFSQNPFLLLWPWAEEGSLKGSPTGGAL